MISVNCVIPGDTTTVTIVVAIYIAMGTNRDYDDFEANSYRDVQEKKVEIMCYVWKKSDNRRFSYLPFDRITLNTLFSVVNALFWIDAMN
jgi:hypothetical protein